MSDLEDEDYEDYEEDSDYGEEEEGGVHRDRWNDKDDEEDENSHEDYEDKDYEDQDSDDQHRQHNAFWKGFRAAIKDDQNQDEHEQEDDGRPYSRSRTPRCSKGCKYYPCDRPIRSPRSSSPVVGPYRASELVESHLSESDYDSESDYVDIPVPPRS